MFRPASILSALRRLLSSAAPREAEAPVPIPIRVRYHLAIPFDHAIERSPGSSGCRQEILDAALGLLRAWTGSARLLGFDVRSGLLWDLSDGEAVPVDRFDGSTVHVLCNLSFLLLDGPPLERLNDGARTHGACWSGVASSRDLLAYAFLVPTPGDGTTAKAVPLPTDALRLVTACLGEDADGDWDTVAARHRAPLAHGPERSPAMANLPDTRARRTVLSPVFWNTALADLGDGTASSDVVGGDPARMSEALQRAMKTTRVPFILNALLNELELRTGAPKPHSHPVEIHLSMTGRCNIECRFCGYTHDIARSDVVTLADIEKLDFLDHVGSLRLNSGLGEPTLNKHLGPIIRHVAERFPHIAINFFTNAIPLGRPGLIDAIVGNVRWINLSLNAATREEWEVQCKADQFDRVCANIAELTRVKRATGSLWPILQASTVLNRSNLHELPAMPALCRRLGIDRLTAFPYFALGFDSHKFGPEMTLAAFRGDYDALYGETIEQARVHDISIEIPLPSESHTATFGLEKRTLSDFAGIESNDWPLARLLSGIRFEKPAGSHCHFLWRQGAIGSTNNAGQSQDATHYLYPCLGPLSSVDLSRRTTFRFEPHFRKLWHSPVFEHLREAQHTAGVCKVCDRCRASDTRDPAGFADLQKLVADFSTQHSGVGPTVVDISAITRARPVRSTKIVDHHAP